MKKSILVLTLCAAPLAFGESTNATTMDYESTDSSTVNQVRNVSPQDSNTSDRFDNRDTRTNSASTPARMGMEDSRLDANVSRDPANTMSPTTEGASLGQSSANSTYGDSLEANTTNSTETLNSATTNTTTNNSTEFSTSNDRLSGSGSASAPATGTATGTATTGTASPSPSGTPSDAAMTGAATGAAVGAAATQETKTKKTKTTTKSKKADGGSKATDSTKTESVQPGESSRTGASTHNMGGSTARNTDETASEMNMMSNDSYRRSGSATDSSAAKGAATGAAAGAMAGNNASRDNAKTGNTDNELTAQDTARNESELELIRRIRSDLVNNKELSMSAHNIKVINQNGQVYLKGPVASATEKSQVEAIAKKVAGNTTVINQTYVEKR